MNLDMRQYQTEGLQMLPNQYLISRHALVGVNQYPALSLKGQTSTIEQQWLAINYVLDIGCVDANIEKTISTRVIRGKNGMKSPVKTCTVIIICLNKPSSSITKM